MTQDIRWMQRFENYDRALKLLREPFDGDVTALSALERGGVIQRFKLVFHLAWGTLQDFFEFEGIAETAGTPHAFIQEAASLGLLSDGAVWLDMLDVHGRLSQTYDESGFEDVVLALRGRYLAAFESLREGYVARRAEA